MSGEDKQSVCFSENPEVKPPSKRTWSGSPAQGWLCATRANLSVADASTRMEPGWPQCCFISVGVKGQGHAQCNIKVENQDQQQQQTPEGTEHLRE